MTTMSLARITQVLQGDFRSTANQLRQGKVVRDKSQSCVMLMMMQVTSGK